MEVVPKIEEVDNKLKKSILASPMNWVFKKYEEQVAKEFLKGNLKAIVDGIRGYCLVLIIIWFVFLSIIWAIVAALFDWIIGKYWWLEPNLSEQNLDI